MASYNKFAKEWALENKFTFSQALTSEDCRKDYQDFLQAVEELKKEKIKKVPVADKVPVRSENRKKKLRKVIVYETDSDDSSDECEQLRSKSRSKREVYDNNNRRKK